MRVSDTAMPGTRRTALACFGLATFMVGAAFASVPLYNIFCKVTGFDGTPLVGTSNPGHTLERKIEVLFDTNVAPGLPWSFRKEVASVSAPIGETQTIFFRVKNEGRKPATGTAAFNVQPGQAGAFFVKLKCFCFEEHTLQPGEAVDFPVVFYVDPAIKNERALDELGAITLSYTYFASKNGEPIASAENGVKPRL